MLLAKAPKPTACSWLMRAEVHQEVQITLLIRAEPQLAPGVLKGKAYTPVPVTVTTILFRSYYHLQVKEQTRRVKGTHTHQVTC